MTEENTQNASFSEFIEIQEKILQKATERALFEKERLDLERQKLTKEEQAAEDARLQRVAAEENVKLLHKLLDAIIDNSNTMKNRIHPSLANIEVLFPALLEVCRTLISFIMHQYRLVNDTEGIAKLRPILNAINGITDKASMPPVPNINIYANPAAYGNVTADKDVNIAGKDIKND
jgi:hypothetical protein